MAVAPWSVIRPASAATLPLDDAAFHSRWSVVEQWLDAEPLALPASGLVAGIWLDAACHVPFLLTLIGFVASGGAMILRRRCGLTLHAAVLVAGVSLGACLHDTQFRRWPSNHLIAYCGDAPTPARVTGIVVALPLVYRQSMGRITWYSELPRTRLMIDGETLEGTRGPLPVTGRVSVVVHEPLLGVAAGDRVEVFGTLHRPRPPANPGEREWALISRRNGVLVEMSCQHAANVSRLAVGSTATSRLSAARRFAIAAMHESAYNEDSAGSRLLDALVLGQRSVVDPDLNRAFINTGTVHYLSVSGAHVGALMSGIWMIGWLLGRARRSCALWAAVAVTAYAVLAEPSAAITRSAIMAIVFCMTMLLRRPARSANSLAAAVIILLVAQPTLLFDPGFQLSFLTLLAVMFLAPRLHATGKWICDKLLRRDDPLLQPEIQRMLNPPSRARLALDSILRKTAWALALSTSAWWVGALISAYHFRQVAPWGWLNTILIIAPMDILLLLGLGKTVLSALMPPLSFIPGWPLRAITNGLIGIVYALNRLPGSGMASPETPGWLVAMGLMVCLFWVMAPPLRLRGRWVSIAFALFVVAGAGNLFLPASGDALRLHLLSIGDGTACFVQLPDGRTIIYDLGSRPPYDMQKWTVGPFLAHERIGSIEMLVITHPQLDHFSAVPDLIDQVRVREILTPAQFLRTPQSTGSAGRLIADLRAHAIPWRTLGAGETLAPMGLVHLEVLWPPRPEQYALRDVNNSSLVLRITFAGRRILLCGDIEELAERELMASTDLSADVLVLPHHGSVVRTTRPFIDAVNPTWCLRSSGRSDHETTAGLPTLLAGRRYLNTADCGAIEVRIGNGELTVMPWHR